MVKKRNKTKSTWYLYRERDYEHSVLRTEVRIEILFRSFHALLKDNINSKIPLMKWALTRLPSRTHGTLGLLQEKLLKP